MLRFSHRTAKTEVILEFVKVKPSVSNIGGFLGARRVLESLAPIPNSRSELAARLTYYIIHYVHTYAPVGEIFIGAIETGRQTCLERGQEVSVFD
jgi:hypothetical protein